MLPLVRVMSSLRVNISLYAFGTRLLVTKKAPTLMRAASTMSGAIRRPSEMPAALMAMSSLFSPIWPMTIMELSSTASGRAVGRMVKAPHIMNSRMTPRPRPLPTSSSM